MLYMIGAVELDTEPFNVDEVDRTATADFAVKPVIGAAPRREFMGEGDDLLILKGQLLPSKVGGLAELETLHSFRRGGQPLPVMRGDGLMFGWFAITEIGESHSDLERDGVGFVLEHTIKMVKVGPQGASPSIISVLRSLFDLAGG